jgi:hypothetical protein
LVVTKKSERGRPLARIERPTPCWSLSPYESAVSSPVPPLEIQTLRFDTPSLIIGKCTPGAISTVGTAAAAWLPRAVPAAKTRESASVSGVAPLIVAPEQAAVACASVLGGRAA